MRVELHIERLVLEGGDLGSRRAVGAALERELGRLIGERGLPDRLATSGDLERIDAGSVDRGRSGRGAEAGRGIARTVYRGMGS